MMSLSSQKAVMKKMAELSKIDKAKIQFTRISKFGLMEISRQKLKSSIIDNNSQVCPTCGGVGYIKSLSTLSVNLVRMLEEEAMKNNKPLTVYLPVRLATYLLNDKRELIQGIEQRQNVTIKVVPDNTIEGANYYIDRENRSNEEFKASLNKVNDKNAKTLNETSSRYEEAIVSAVAPKSLPPKPVFTKKIAQKKKTGVFSSLIENIKSLLGIKTKKTFKNRPYNSRRRYSKTNFNKSNNKYKSYNRRKGYQGKNNNRKTTNVSQGKNTNNN